MSQGDYTTLMGILSDNMQEGTPPPSSHPPPDVTAIDVPAQLPETAGNYDT